MIVKQKFYYCIFEDPLFTVGNRNLPFDSTRFALAIRRVTHEIAGHAWPALIDVAVGAEPHLSLLPLMTRPSTANVWGCQCLGAISKRTVAQKSGIRSWRRVFTQDTTIGSCWSIRKHAFKNGWMWEQLENMSTHLTTSYEKMFMIPSLIMLIMLYWAL